MIEHFAPQREADEARLVIQPNLSLTLRQLLAVFALLAIVTTAIAGVAGLQGNFFALPFAALYLSMLGGCFALVWRRGRRAEVIAMVPGRVSVRHLPELFEVFADDPYWVRVVEAEGHVWLANRRRQVEVGELVGESERQQLAQLLRQMLQAAPPEGIDGDSRVGR
jgi:uncharacterized membrane protein